MAPKLSLTILALAVLLVPRELGTGQRQRILAFPPVPLAKETEPFVNTSVCLLSVPCGSRREKQEGVS